MVCGCGRATVVPVNAPTHGARMFFRKGRFHHGQERNDMHRVSLQPPTRIRSSVYSALWLILLSALSLQAQTVHVGAGSYTTTLPTGAAAPSSQIFNTVAGPKP